MSKEGKLRWGVSCSFDFISLPEASPILSSFSLNFSSFLTIPIHCEEKGVSVWASWVFHLNFPNSSLFWPLQVIVMRKGWRVSRLGFLSITRCEPPTNPASAQIGIPVSLFNFFIILKKIIIFLISDKTVQASQQSCLRRNWDPGVRLQNVLF